MSDHHTRPDGTTETVHHGARQVNIGPEKKSSLGWLWLLLIPLLILLLAWLFWPRHHDDQTAQSTPPATTQAAPQSNDAQTPAVATATPATPAPPAADVPPGSGVVDDSKDGHPALIVYFDTAKADVSQDLAGASAKLKSYLDEHSGATVSVSGYNDPTGDAALNADLSKRRAEGVGKALQDAGIPADKIKLEKPADSTASGDTNSQARRVEVVVHD